MDEYVNNLLYVIRNGDMENTYKMAWIRSLVEHCDLRPDEANVHFDELSSLIFGYYWNQTIFFGLEQGPNTNKRPRIHQIVRYHVDTYRQNYGMQPVYYQKVQDLIDVDFSQISSVLRLDVCWRFQKVGKEEYEFYDLDRDARTVSIHKPGIIKEHSSLLYEVINYRWSQKLEDFNWSPRISQKVRGVDRQDIKRRSLHPFRKLLDIENPRHISFITGKPIAEDDLSIDHVIPWSYIYSDDLWNLVYVESNENSSKNNRIPDEEMINRLEARNESFGRLLASAGVRNKHAEELSLAIENDLARRFWIGCKG